MLRFCQVLCCDKSQPRCVIATRELSALYSPLSTRGAARAASHTSSVRGRASPDAPSGPSVYIQCWDWRKAMLAKGAAIQMAAVMLLADSVQGGAEGPPSPPAPRVRVELLAASGEIPRSGELWLGVRFRIDPGWHIYWRNRPFWVTAWTNWAFFKNAVREESGERLESKPMAPTGRLAVPVRPKWERCKM